MHRWMLLLLAATGCEKEGPIIRPEDPRARVTMTDGETTVELDALMTANDEALYDIIDYPIIRITSPEGDKTVEVEAQFEHGFDRVFTRGDTRRAVASSDVPLECIRPEHCGAYVTASLCVSTIQFDSVHAVECSDWAQARVECITLDE